jgi:hypothetical protein
MTEPKTGLASLELKDAVRLRWTLHDIKSQRTERGLGPGRKFALPLGSPARAKGKEVRQPIQEESHGMVERENIDSEYPNLQLGTRDSGSRRNLDYPLDRRTLSSP